MTDKRKRLDAGYSYEDKWIPVADLKLDPRVNTKPYYPARVEEMAKDFNPAAIGLLVVSQRADGSYYCVDGWHRKNLLERVGWGDQLVQCRVYTGLTLAQEARLFRDVNHGFKPNRMDDFQAALTEGDPEAVAINNIVRSVGLAVSRAAGSGHITAIRALQRVYRGDAKVAKNADPRALLHALETVRDAWGPDTSSFRGTVLEGLGLVYLKENGRIDPKRMIEKLTGVPGGAANVEARAQQAKDIHNRSLPYSAAGVIADLYNKGTPASKQLQSWWS